MSYTGYVNDLQLKPDAAASETKPAGNITDKRGFGVRWGFSPRHIDNLIAQGLPHLKIGKRRVRILNDEGDAWMKEKFATRRNANLAKA
jgi:hypothetical protein